MALAPIAMLAGQSARATSLLNDNFDSYASQVAFNAAWSPVGTTTDSTKQGVQLSTAKASSAPNSAYVPVDTTATSTSTEYRSRRSFAETSTASSSGNLGVGDEITWSFDFYDFEADSSSNPQRNYATLEDTTAPTGTNQLISLGLNNNLLAADQGGNYYEARILGGASNGGTASQFFKLNDAGAPLRSTGWHNLKTVITTSDGVSTNYEFYVDNTLAETVSGVGAAGSLRSYDNIVIGSGLTNGGVDAYFDNMKVDAGPATSAPEPSSLALLGVAGVAVLRRRRRA